MSATKFHTHTEQRAKLQFYIIYRGKKKRISQHFVATVFDVIMFTILL